MRVQIGFSTSASWISRTIERVTGGPASHAFFKVTIENGRELVLQEDVHGWAFVTFQKFQSGTTRVVDMIDAPVPIDDAFWESLDNLNERYSYVGLVGMLWVELGRRLGRRWRNPLRTSNEAFCSQMVVEVLQRAGWWPALALDAESVDPWELDQLLRPKAA